MVITDFHPFFWGGEHVSSFELVSRWLANYYHPNSSKKGRKNTKMGRHQSHSVITFMLHKCQLIAERQTPENHTEGNVVPRKSQLIEILCFITFYLKVILVFEYSIPTPGLPEWTRIQFQNTFIALFIC